MKWHDVCCQDLSSESGALSIRLLFHISYFSFIYWLFLLRLAPLLALCWFTASSRCQTSGGIGQAGQAGQANWWRINQTNSWNPSFPPQKKLLGNMSDRTYELEPEDKQPWVELVSLLRPLICFATRSSFHKHSISSILLAYQHSGYCSTAPVTCASALCSVEGWRLPCHQKAIGWRVRLLLMRWMLGERHCTVFFPLLLHLGISQRSGDLQSACTCFWIPCRSGGAR